MSKLDYIDLVEEHAINLSGARALRSTLSLGVERGYILERHKVAVLATLRETKDAGEGWSHLASIIWHSCGDPAWGWTPAKKRSTAPPM